jgi:3-deoxy-7-phosphoheptulonate synthase
MIESNIGPGNQSIKNPDGLAYGVSITDACIDWDETKRELNKLSEQLKGR